MKHGNISTQSEWVRAHIMNVNPKAKIFKTSISLRTEFAEADKWNVDNCVSYQVFTSTSSIISYKGLHILIDAIASLKKNILKLGCVLLGML